MRIAKPQGIDQNLVEGFQLVVRYQTRANEMPYYSSQANANRNVRQDEHRQRNEEASVGRDILKERNLRAAHREPL